MEYKKESMQSARIVLKKIMTSMVLLLLLSLCYSVCKWLSISHLHIWHDQWPHPNSFSSVYYFLASVHATLAYVFGDYCILFGICSWIWWSLVLLAHQLERYLLLLCYVPVQFLALVLLREYFARYYQDDTEIHSFFLPIGILRRLQAHWYVMTPLLVFISVIGAWWCVWPFLRELYRCIRGADDSELFSWSPMSEQLEHSVADTHVIYEGSKKEDQEQVGYVTSSDAPAIKSREEEVSIGCTGQPYKLPSARVLFASAPIDQARKNIAANTSQAMLLKQKLARFGVAGSVVRVTHGPVVTLYEYEPAEHVKVSKILALEHDLALALKARSMRIIAPIPGKSVVGFEVANQQRELVSFGAIAKTFDFTRSSYQIPLILGKDTTGKNVITDLARAPHILVAGSTGSGKSVCLNTMLASILLAKKPEECKCILIDPKRLEFIPYASIGHLLFPVVTDPKKAVQVLSWLVGEMERRYKLLAQYGVRNNISYNGMAKQKGHKLLPHIVVLIDELADLMMVSGKEIEQSIMRLAQMARAAGIHLIVATQRPSVDVVTGLIKVNIPSRIAFQVTSKIDSRTILDAIGAECLLGKGDMLAQLGSAAGLQRLHGAYIDDASITKLVQQVSCQGSPAYVDLSAIVGTNEDNQEDDSLLPEVERFIETVHEISISSLQRRFHIGYNRSARLVEMLEQKGKLMPPTGSKMRKVIK